MATMAKSFPRWVSAGAISAWKEAADLERSMIEASNSRPATGPRAARTIQEVMIYTWRNAREPLPSELFGRLLTDSAKTAWCAVSKQSTAKQVGAIDSLSLLSHFLIRACWGPMFDERMTRAEYSKHRARAKALAEELAQLIYGTKLDHWLSQHVANLEMMVANDPKWRPALAARYGGCEANGLVDALDGTRGWFLSRMSRVLQEFASAIEGDQQPAVSLPKPNDANARRAYFVKSATEACLFIFGKLMRREVATFASAAFNCNMTEREVRRLAPDTRKT